MKCNTVQRFMKHLALKCSSPLGSTSPGLHSEQTSLQIDKIFSHLVSIDLFLENRSSRLMYTLLKSQLWFQVRRYRIYHFRLNPEKPVLEKDIHPKRFRLYSLKRLRQLKRCLHRHHLLHHPGNPSPSLRGLKSKKTNPKRSIKPSVVADLQGTPIKFKHLRALMSKSGGVSWKVVRPLIEQSLEQLPSVPILGFQPGQTPTSAFIATKSLIVQEIGLRNFH